MSDAVSPDHHSAEQPGDPAGQGLAGRLSGLARDLQHEADADTLLADIVKAAVELIPGTDQASISLVEARRHVISRAPSDELARRVDALQEEVGEGPCLDSAYQEQTVTVPDMGDEERWPRFAERASEAGVGSMLAFQLFVEGDNLGALNLYSLTPHAFDAESEHVGTLFASHAAIAFAGLRKQDQLNRALDTRDLIGMAKGILMERYTVDPDRAFQILVRTSQENQRKLRDMAAELVQHGTFGGRRPDSSVA